MGATSTTLDPILKDQILPTIRKLFYDSSILRKYVDKDHESVEGDQILISLHYGRSMAVSGVAEGGTLPTAKNQRFARTSFSTKEHYGKFRVSAKAMRRTKTNKGALAKALTVESEGTKSDMGRFASICMWGDGTSKFATCGTTTGSLTVVVDSTKNLFVGMIVDIVIATTGVAITDGTARTIATIPNATTFTMAGNVVTTSSIHVVVPTGSWGTVCMGIEGIVSASNPPTGDFEGIDRAAQLWWGSNVLTHATPGTTRALSFDLLNDMINWINIGGGKCSLILSNFGPEKKYGALCTAIRQIVNKMTLDGGYEAVLYKGIPWYTDPLAPFQTSIIGDIWGIDVSRLTIWTMTPGGFEWLNEDGQTLRLATDGTAAFEGIIVWDAELGTDNSKAHCALRDITTDAELGMMSV